MVSFIDFGSQLNVKIVYCVVLASLHLARQNYSIDSGPVLPYYLEPALLAHYVELSILHALTASFHCCEANEVGYASYWVIYDVNQLHWRHATQKGFLTGKRKLLQDKMEKRIMKERTL